MSIGASSEWMGISKVRMHTSSSRKLVPPKCACVRVAAVSFNWARISKVRMCTSSSREAERCSSSDCLKFIRLNRAPIPSLLFPRYRSSNCVKFIRRNCTTVESSYLAELRWMSRAPLSGCPRSRSCESPEDSRHRHSDTHAPAPNRPGAAECGSKPG